MSEIAPTSSLPALPSDVLILMIDYLSIQDLVRLSECCWALNALVAEFGWNTWLRENPRPSYSLAPVYDHWTPKEQMIYHVLSDKGWEGSQFVARPLGRPWLGKFRPALAFSSSRLLIGAGNKLHSYAFSPPKLLVRKSGHLTAPYITHECVYEIDCGLPGQKSDITSLVFVPDIPSDDSNNGSVEEGSDRTVCVSFSNGMIWRVYLPPPLPSQPVVPVTVLETHDFFVGECIEHMSLRSSTMVSVSSLGIASLIDPTKLSHIPETIDLRERSWTSYLSPSLTYVAFGLSSANPLATHAITPSELSPRPHALLAPSPGSRAGRSLRLSAVYGICGTPPGFPGGSSDQIIVSGWYDGFVRIHDLRDSTRTSTSTPVASPTPTSSSSPSRSPSPSASVTSHLPVLSLNDPWSLEPIYAIAAGGGASAHIGAGSARHSVVSFWDVRAHRRAVGHGWSVHAPGNDPSPVYALAMEGGRAFGVTQSRGFVYDFGPGVEEGTYPPLMTGPDRSRGAGGWQARAVDGLGEREGYGYYVTKYHFNRKTPF